ncbi:MAG: CHAT domain-containing protein, partial [Syntrophobacteraceae bacterium]|nr:CHAT domain-containing protein [Syntrophobacteraceae bacterium]
MGGWIPMKVHDPPENSRSDEPAPSIEEFLRKKDELDQAIRDRFQRLIAVVFTDIAASTDYFERRGDLAGRLMLQRHHDLLRPIVEDHGGRILKTLGDGWMISFEDPVQAALAGAEMQRRVSLENRQREPADQVRIKIGMHWGLGFVEETDVYGDVPNTAARLCSLAKGGDILISSSFAEAIRQSQEVSHEYAGVKTLKGKAQPMDVYRILWDPCREPDARRTIPRETALLDRQESPLSLAFTLEDEDVRIDVAWGKEDGGKSRIYRIPFREKEIRDLVEEIDRCLEKVDSRGRVSREQVRGLKDLGANLREVLVPHDLASLILDLAPDTLLCRIDPSLVHVPWELLHDGETFFCLKYGMGRTVPLPTASDVPARKSNPSSLRVLIVADPGGDLAAAGAEGISVRKVFTRADISGMKVFLKGREATCAFIESQLPKADLFHFAGHADYDPSDPSLSGFFLSDGKFETGRLLSLARKG